MPKKKEEKAPAQEEVRSTGRSIFTGRHVTRVVPSAAVPGGGTAPQGPTYASAHVRLSREHHRLQSLSGPPAAHGEM